MGARLGHEEWPGAGGAGAPGDGGAGGAGGAGGVAGPEDAMRVGKPLASDRASAGMKAASLAYH